MSHCEELGGREKLLPQDGNLGRRRRHDRKFNNGRLPKAGGTPVKNDDGKKSRESIYTCCLRGQVNAGLQAGDCSWQGNSGLQADSSDGQTPPMAANRSGLCAEAAMTVNILEF
ncbi:uncharacterized protein LOC124269836 [Haliotis rubra]|uniref:uncharacterized protein LOC124269836 n=1 Tax=Haliotis rubra TaxID=36100 RepID=UPI001EE5C7EE|nr:uncharacterized protein LOC124269836 [Haliotis rubra]